MFSAITTVLKYRDLWYMLTLRDIRIRYKQAAMGFLWAIFMPMVAIAAGILIKKAMAEASHKPVDMLAIVSITVKVLPWTFFVSSIRFAVQSLVGNSTLITKIYFPRAVLPFAAISACAFDMAIAGALLLLLLTVFQLGISIYLLWLPLILLLLFLFTVGLGLILAAANLFFRDVRYIVEIILMFGIFFTPVFYDASSFDRYWRSVLLLNPMGSILESLNQVVVLKQAPDMFWITYAALASLATFYVGSLIFQKTERSFAENI